MGSTSNWTNLLSGAHIMRNAYPLSLRTNIPPQDSLKSSQVIKAGSVFDLGIWRGQNALTTSSLSVDITNECIGVSSDYSSAA